MGQPIDSVEERRNSLGDFVLLCASLLKGEQHVSQERDEIAVDAVLIAFPEWTGLREDAIERLGQTPIGKVAAF